jgi:hypothetical protein
METETKIEINVKRKDTYCLTFLENPIYFSLMRSVKDMLDTSICTQIKNNLILKAKKVRYYSDFLNEESLKHGVNSPLSHAWCLRIVYCLSKQIEYLVSNESKCFYKLDYHHLMVMDDCFFYLSPNALIPVEEEKMHIYSYSLKDGFFSPELTLDSKVIIPISVHYKTIYYSLGLLLVSALKDDNNVYNNDYSVQNINNHPLEKINGTKLYFFIVRCLQKEIHDRYLIFL